MKTQASKAAALLRGGDVGSPREETCGDEELLRLVREGDRTAYGELWLRYTGLAEAVARPFAKEDTEDAVSEAFAAIWDQIQRGGGPQGSFRGYLLATVRNVSAQWHRKLGRVYTGVDLEGEVAEDRTIEIEHEEEARDIKAAFETLPDRWRQVLWMTEVESRARDEVAETLSLTPNSTAQLLRRAKEGLRIAWLGERASVEDAAVHPAVAQDLPRFVRGGLPAKKRESIQRHLRECEHCCKREQDLRHESSVFGAALGLIPLVGGAAAVGLAEVTSQGSIAAASATPILRLQHTLREAVHVLRPNIGLVATVGVTAVALVAAVMLPGVGLTEGSSSPTKSGTPAAAADDEREGEGADDSDAIAEAAPEVDESAVGDGQLAGESVPEALPVGPGEATPIPSSPIVNTRTAPTIEVRGPAAGDIAPRVGGSASSDLPLRVAVSGVERTVSVSSGGAWEVDLSQFGLGAGTHSVRASQSADGVDYLSGALNFSLLLPSVSAPPLAVGSARMTLRIAGIPGASVCVALPSGEQLHAVLSDAGIAKVSALAGANAGGVAVFHYCNGSRTGPTGSLVLP